jgi:hypothetical protein
VRRAQGIRLGGLHGFGQQLDADLAEHRDQRLAEGRIGSVV